MAENNQGVINALKESNKAAAGVIKDELCLLYTSPSPRDS